MTWGLTYFDQFTSSECIEHGKIFIFQYFSFYEQMKCHAQLSGAPKSLITSGPGPVAVRDK